MNNYNRDTLIKNINIQLKNNNMTQTDFAEKLGMVQSNISKALNPKEKKNFTIEQIVDIAVLFSISLDKLLGIKENSIEKTSPKSVALFLTQLIENDDVKMKTIKIEEEVYKEVNHFNVFGDSSGYPFEPVKQNNNYYSFYLPSYWEVPKNYPHFDGTDDEGDELRSAANIGGNETIMLPANDYLNNFLSIFKLYKDGSLDEYTYNSVVEGLISKLPN